jgi:hypothetical protein
MLRQVQITDFHVKYYAYELTKRSASDHQERDFLQLRNSEADNVRCGKKHFEALGVPLAVAVTADEV